MSTSEMILRVLKEWKVTNLQVHEETGGDYWMGRATMCDTVIGWLENLDD